MFSIDHKIPPPVIALVCAGLAWAFAHFSPGFNYPLPFRLPVAVVLVLAGFGLDLSGLLAFRKANTTLNPLSPDRSTAIVQSGPYALTRNPMYLGMAIVLLGLCVYLENPLTVICVGIFVGYITRFQIIPEERLLLGKFGEPYAQYMRAVRRWI
jgi:protein-S-isoprenylcysteine O-methyltransferase Ste14